MEKTQERADIAVELLAIEIDRIVARLSVCAARLIEEDGRPTRAHDVIRALDSLRLATESLRMR